MSVANSKLFRITKAYATSEFSNNKKTCQQLAETTTPSIPLTTTQMLNLPPLFRTWCINIKFITTTKIECPVNIRCVQIFRLSSVYV